MAKKAVLVITDPGMPPTVFVVPDEALNEGDIKRLNRLLEYVGSYDFDAEDFRECANLKEVHDALIEQLGLKDDEEAPEFDWYPDQKLAVTRAEVKKRDLAKRYKKNLNVGGTVSGRLSSKGEHLANLPKPGPSLRQEAKRFDFGSPSPTGRFPSQPEQQHINPLLKTNPRVDAEFDFNFDYAEIEKRLFAAIGPPIAQIYDEYVFEVADKDAPAAREAMKQFCEEVFKNVRFPLVRVGDFTMYDAGSSRWSSKESNLQELPKTMKTPNGKEINRTWDPCCEGCLGWLHMNSPYEVEQCDECKRFGLTPEGHAKAILAHREECGCGWPELDIQDAAMAWARDMGPEMDDDVKELRELLDERGIGFMDNVTPAIYVCSRILETAAKDSPNHTAGLGLMKLLQETQGKIHNEELKLKDFGDPPGVEEDEEGCDDCGGKLDEGRCPKCDGSFTHP